MATQDKRVTMDGLVSATVKYSNKDDAERTYDISADVNISNGKVSSVNNGMVYKKSDMTTGSGNFSMGGESDYMSYNANGWGKEDCIHSLEAIYAFMESVKENVKINQVNA